MLIHAFIQPHINCVFLFWGNATVTNLRPIKKKPPESNLYWTSLQKAQDIKLWATKKIVIEGFTWKVKNYTIPKTLQSHFCKWNRVFGQNNPKYHIPLANTKLLKQGITCQWPRVWNNRNLTWKKKKVSPRVFKQNLLNNNIG